MAMDYYGLGLFQGLKMQVTFSRNARYMVHRHQGKGKEKVRYMENLHTNMTTDRHKGS